MLSASQIEEVRRTFSILPANHNVIGLLFYQTLFEIDPTLKPLFKGNIREQGKKLIAMLALVVEDATDLGRLLPSLENLAIRHVGYGVVESHYATIGRALQQTLQTALGTAFTEASRSAWQEAYSELSTAMIRATRETLAHRDKSPDG